MKWEDKIEERLAKLEEFVKQEKCVHSMVTFKTFWVGSSDGEYGGHAYSKDCVFCKKRLVYYTDEKKWLKDKRVEIDKKLAGVDRWEVAEKT